MKKIIGKPAARAKGRQLGVHLAMTVKRNACRVLAGAALILGSCMSPASAQKIGDGLWNAGGSVAPLPALYADSLQFRALLARVQLYPGYAVVRTDLDILNTSEDTLFSRMQFTDSASHPHPLLRKVSGLPPLARMVLQGKDTLATDAPLRFIPGLNRVSVLEITPNNQAILSREGRVKEANAFLYTLPASGSGQRRVLVELRGGLSLTRILGVEPGTAEGTRSRLSFTLGEPALGEPALQERSMVIWYEGAAPDLNLSKKIIPLKDQWFREMDGFDLSEFGSPEFRRIDKDDFSVNRRSPLISFVYFLMFSVPWLLLLGFLLWLAFRPRKKTTST